MTPQRGFPVGLGAVVIMVLALMVSAFTAAASGAMWSSPTTVSAPHDAIEPIVLSSGGVPSGDLVYWHFNDLVPPTREIFGATGARYVTAAAGGVFGSEHALPAGYGSGPLVNLGEGRVAQLILRRTRAGNSEPEVVLGTVAGGFGVPMRVHAAVLSASLVGNSRGELLLAWIATLPSGRRQVWASLRAAGHGFGRPELLSSSADAQQVTAAIGGPVHRTDTPGFAADMLVAFASKRGRMLVRVRYHQLGWGPVQDAGPAAVGNANDVAVNIGRNGRVVLAWFHQQLSEGGALGPGFTTVAVRPANARGFLRSQTLERDRNASQVNRPVLINDAGRGLALAFIAQPGAQIAGFTPTVLRVSYSHGDRFGAPQTISLAGQQVSDLAGAEGPGNDILTWSGGPNPPVSALGPAPAVYAATGGTTINRLGAVQRASPEEQAEVPMPIYSLVSGGWLLAWRGHPGYQSPTDRGRPVVRVARCPGTCS
jgi:hypothetical protein